MVLNHETAFAWTATERGRLDDRYFPPVKIPTVPHTPWILRNIPIPPSSWDQAIQIIKDHIASGVYELSATASQSYWFCVLKQDSKMLQLMHDLWPLNIVTIQDSLVPPFIEHLAGSFSGYVVYSIMDLQYSLDMTNVHYTWTPEIWLHLIVHSDRIVLLLYQWGILILSRFTRPTWHSFSRMRYHTTPCRSSMTCRWSPRHPSTKDWMACTKQYRRTWASGYLSGNISLSSTESSNTSRTLMQLFQLRNSSLLLWTPPLLVTSAPPKVGFHMRLKSRRSEIGWNARILRKSVGS